jgi:hypothetical protein
MKHIEDSNYKHVAQRILSIMQEHRSSKHKSTAGDSTYNLTEESTFYIYRTDTNAVLARGVPGFEAAKTKANQLRKSHGLKWDQVKFKAERARKQFGVSADGRSFTNAYGQQGRMDYARNYNPSKGKRFSGYYDQQGNYHDLD